MATPNELKIQIYKVDDFEHHVPESIDEAFKAEVKQARKQYQSINDYETLSDSHEESSRKPVVDNKIFHSTDGVLIEAIQDINVQIYESYSLDGGRSEGDNFIIHCPLEQTDVLERQITFKNQQSKEIKEYSF